MADIWDRVNEAIDTDPLQLRGIVGELLARAEHAEEGAQLSSERLAKVRAELAEAKAATEQLLKPYPDGAVFAMLTADGWKPVLSAADLRSALGGAP